ncbi:MAG: 2,3-bisphosphoglycerate-independent phosphoglycerate mutase [Bacillota bacterium]|nr:2,3-bisphosphoglycerate-independent phosphoglycerate mutase [Bacillota bacterium]
MPAGGSRFVLLVILDGWGLLDTKEGNAINLGYTPNLDEFLRKFPSTRLASSGTAVGLPENQMGNSEVGHLNLGAGSIVLQEMMRISKSIEDGSFSKNKVLLNLLHIVKEKNSALHIMGLLSDGGVHSHNSHLYALLRLAKTNGLERVYIHAILDGRDAPPKSAAAYLEELESAIASIGVGRVAGIAGRYFSMDRDRHWERIEQSYRAYVYGEGHQAISSMAAIGAAYDRGETDEFVSPTVILNDDFPFPALINNDDGLVFFNFRADRARQISRAFVRKDFDAFDRGASPTYPNFVSFTEYDSHLNIPVVFPSDHLKGTLGEVVSKSGLKQLRVAETEKYAHVTYFFNGGREEPFPGEERILVPSPRVDTYDLQPEMSASKVTEEVLKALDKDKYNLIVVNYANADMVGHTGKLDESIKAVETVDREVGKIVDKVMQKGGITIITADHGNAEKIFSENGTPHTAHTNNDTPFIIISAEREYLLPPRGKLADVAPTILKLLFLPVPVEMDGTSLV